VVDPVVIHKNEKMHEEKENKIYILYLFLSKMHASLEIEKRGFSPFLNQNRYTLPFRPCVGVNLMLIDYPLVATI
jgi:hypothetical protein